VTLEYGRSLRTHGDGAGDVPVYGTNGRIGYCEQPLCPHAGVVVGRKGAYRGVHYADVPFFVIDTAFWLKPKTDIELRWAYYALLTQDINGLDTGSAIPSTTRESFYVLPVEVPPRDEQKQIASVLGALDDKIDLNRRIVVTANELAHAVFRSRYRSDDPDLPHERLGEHLDVARGLSYSGAGLADEGMPLHNLDSIRAGGGYSRKGIKHYTGDYAARHIVVPGDVLVASVDLTWNFRVVASPARIPVRFGDGLFSQDLFAVRPKPGSPLSRQFIYLMLLPGRLRSEIAGYANGTTVNRIPLEALQKPRFAVPPRELVEEVDAVVTPLFERAEAAEDESETLAELRDTLLPKLISGELRLREGKQAKL
jgi:type I restriction enzyme S subunit